MAPGLRYPLLGYLAAVALTRMTFGAHFPLDVLLGTIIGWQVGLFAVALTRAARLLLRLRPPPRRLGASPRGPRSRRPHDARRRRDEAPVATSTPIAPPRG